MKIVTVIGARPQFVKAAVVSRALSEDGRHVEILVHTGQHYDERMSSIFFAELGIPLPVHNLGVGSGTHGNQTGKMLQAVEEILLHEQPQALLVYGDTNSTLAGALAAAKLNIPVAHVEAGLRSFNRRMPEEINRVLTDHVSKLLFCPTNDAVSNLAREGITGGVDLVGDVMYDCAKLFGPIAEQRCNPLQEHGLEHGKYCLLTVHRAENTDDPRRFADILRGVNRISAELPVLFPAHPRTRKLLDRADQPLSSGVRLTEPMSYLEMLVAERNAAVIVTDSGGVQKEAFFWGVPCMTLRDETEWTETLEAGANRLVGTDPDVLLTEMRQALSGRHAMQDAGPFYGEGQAAQRIASRMSLIDQ